jgi:hypothetical protein
VILSTMSLISVLSSENDARYEVPAPKTRQTR